MLLHLGRDGHALAHQDRDQPVGGPGALGDIVDARERLKRHAVVSAFGEAAAKIVPVATHGERGGADRSAKVEGEDLGLLVAPELQRHQRQQHRFARAGRTNDQRMADIADMDGKPERGRALGLAEQQWGCCKMLVPFRSRPHRRQRDHVGEIQCVDRGLADIGVDMARQRMAGRKRSPKPSVPQPPNRGASSVGVS